MLQQPDQGVAEVHHGDGVAARTFRAGLRAELGEPAPPAAAAPPAVGGQVVQDPAQVPLGVLADLVPVFEQPLKRGFALVWNYVTTPISGSLTMAMMIDTIVEFALYGAIVGSIYKPLRSAVRHPATI